MSITVAADTPEGQLVLNTYSQAKAFRSLIPDSEWQRVEAYFGQDSGGASGGGGSSGGGSSGGGGGGGGSSEPSGSPDVRITDFSLSSGSPDQQPPLAAGDRVRFEIGLVNRGSRDKFEQDFTVDALGQQVFSGSLASPTNSPTQRNLIVTVPQVDSERPVEFCAKLSDKNETECVTYRVTPDFDPDAVEVTQIEVPSQIRLGDDLSGTIRVDNPNPKTAQVRWRVDFGGGTVADDGVTRVPGEKVVEIPYSGRAPEYDGQFEVCGRLDSVTPR
jgi:hypothetical protein